MNSSRWPIFATLALMIGLVGGNAAFKRVKSGKPAQNAESEWASKPTATEELIQTSSGLPLRHFVRDSGELEFYPVGAEGQKAALRLATSDLFVQLAAGVNESDVLPSSAISQPAAAPESWHCWRFPSVMAAYEAWQSLRNQPTLAAVELGMTRQLAEKAVPTDPFLTQQWHLSNSGQLASILPNTVAGEDLNMLPLWSSTENWNGQGVLIGILDDGLEAQHPDLAGRVETSLGRNWNTGITAIPFDNRTAPQTGDDFHGTAVAGLAAASANNGLGGVGVASSATLVPLRITATPLTDAQEAQAILYLINSPSSEPTISIKNASYGAPDRVGYFDGPGPMTKQALSQATRTGRGGKGTIFVFAAGNGGASAEDANWDGYTNDPHVITVSAVDDRGKAPPYAEGGACIALSAPSGTENRTGLITTDLTGSVQTSLIGLNPRTGGLSFAQGELTDVRFTNAFSGTSAAAPLISGVCALMLQANPALNWREVKEILMRTARKSEPTSSLWFNNAAPAATGGPFHFHLWHGAGTVDAAAAVALAKTFAPLGPERELVDNISTSTPIPDAPVTSVNPWIERSFDFTDSMRVEHVQLSLRVDGTRPSDLRINLISPNGTTSTLARPRVFSGSRPNQWSWALSSVHFWGEMAKGQWTLRIRDDMRASGEPSIGGNLGPTTLILSGTLRSRYDQWRDQEIDHDHDLPPTAGDPDADPDGDGQTNLCEYAFGTSPRTYNRQPLNVGSEIDGSSQRPVIEFQRAQGRLEVDYFVELALFDGPWVVIAHSHDGQPLTTTNAARFHITESLVGNLIQTRLTDTQPAAKGEMMRVRTTLGR